MFLVSVDRSETNVVRYDEPQIQTLVSRHITAPVTSFITGQASIDRAVSAAPLVTPSPQRAHRPRDPLRAAAARTARAGAALLVTAVGAISALAGFGEVALLGTRSRLTPSASRWAP
jgi:hypothetical protein